MTCLASIFLDVALPNSATWFYCSLLLAVALFFKFSRLLSMRNLDLALIVLPAPGLMLLLDGGVEPGWGFGWLLTASLILLVRCLFDPALERRPALRPNLSPGGLGWLAAALFGSLVVVAAQEPRASNGTERKRTAFSARVQREGEQLLGREGDAGLDQTVSRGLAVACHLAVVVALFLIGGRHFHDYHAGIAMATFYLLLPYTYFLLPYGGPLGGQWYHVWPTALLCWAVFFHRRPTVAGLLIGIAAAGVHHPVLVVPIWVGFHIRGGWGRFLGAFAVGAGLCVVWLFAAAGFSGEMPANLADVWPLELQDWQPWFSPSEDSASFWGGIHWAYRMPVFLVYLVLVLLTAFWPAPKNLGHLIAMSAALLLGAQLWYADRGGMHVLWYLPFLLLMAFRPNLSTCTAPPIVPETDWLHRLRRRLRRLIVRSAPDDTPRPVPTER